MGDMVMESAKAGACKTTTAKRLAQRPVKIVLILRCECVFIFLLINCYLFDVQLNPSLA